MQVLYDYDYMFFFKRTSSKLIECKTKSDSFFRIRIESASVGGSNKDGKYVF